MVPLMVLVALLVGACDWPQWRAGPQHTGAGVDTTIGRDNVTSLQDSWASDPGDGFHATGSPIVAGGKAFVAEVGPSGAMWRVAAYDATGRESCTGTPLTCSPLWTVEDAGGGGAPAVANGVLFAPLRVDPTGWVRVGAFDAKGSTNCSGTPKVCLPMWTYDPGGAYTGGETPVVAGTVLYVAHRAFDARGQTGCAGTPAVCAPLWDYVAPPAAIALVGVPSIAGATLYSYGGDGNLYAFNAAGTPGGVTGCSVNGSPRSCNAVWVGLTHAGGPGAGTAPVVANSRVYVITQLHQLVVFGSAGCKIIEPGDPLPIPCEPVWTAATTGATRDPAVSGRDLWVSSSGPSALQEFDAYGENGCTSLPVATNTCDPLVTLPLATSPGVPSIANGVLHVDTVDASSPPPFEYGLAAFRIGGPYVCATVAPFVCAPDWSTSFGQVAERPGYPVVASGHLIVNAGGVLRAFAPPG